MVRITEKYDAGDSVTYSESVPFKDREKLEPGTKLHMIFIVKLISSKPSDKTKKAVVREAISPDLFNYDEKVPAEHHVIQAIKNSKGHVSFRLLTGQPIVYGRVIFKYERNGTSHVNVLTIRSRIQYEKYLAAAKVITETSPGPHRLINVEGTKFTYETIGTKRIRSIEFIQGSK